MNFKYKIYVSSYKICLRIHAYPYKRINWAKIYGTCFFSLSQICYLFLIQFEDHTLCVPFAVRCYPLAHKSIDTSNAWNLLSSFIKSSPSLSIFKKKVGFFHIQTKRYVGFSHLLTSIGIILKTRKPIFVLVRKIRQKL